ASKIRGGKYSWAGAMIIGPNTPMPCQKWPPASSFLPPGAAQFPALGFAQGSSVHCSLLRCFAFSCVFVDNLPLFRVCPRVANIAARFTEGILA
ncbi:MAG: hypothetical protein LBF93_10235, partial [Zoogloeaceae bacterium]|nr:hypothetical protein [Zoogloeaceae bacterium]